LSIWPYLYRAAWWSILRVGQREKELLTQMSTAIAALICLVVAVTDGDTLKVRCGAPGAYQQIIIRLAEIDAPERRQPFGDLSRQALADSCFKVDAVVRPSTRDRYGRTVARVECRGEDASASQVRAGMAWAYTKYLTDPSIQQIEAVARGQKVGLWADADPRPPWEWRLSSKNMNKKGG
jgi:endonuclease YncB( thermonuclease family)